MNKGQFLLKLKKFNEKIFVGNTLTLISMISEEYFGDGIIKIKSLFENLEDEPTKKIIMTK